MQKAPAPSNFYTLLWAGLFFVALAWSYTGAKDEYTWWLEALPALSGAIILLLTRSQYPLTPLLYLLILLHCIVLLVGAHYTYAEVPLFDWLREVFGQSRNNYDKVGHFFQGMVPTLIAREILIRESIVNGRLWVNTLAVSVALAFSAFYELIEWTVALMSQTAADAFLGTQGYEWDTQSDMAWALVGALFAIVFLGHWHNRQIQRLLAQP